VRTRADTCTQGLTVGMQSALQPVFLDRQTFTIAAQKFQATHSIVQNANYNCLP